MKSLEDLAEDFINSYAGMDVEYTEDIMRDSFIAGANADRWISVKDALPETNEDVLVYSAYTYLGYYMDGEWRCEHGPFTGVTHWQPFPAGPKTK